ncbi:hypothetical protein QBC47DRAFT_389229 [Echria macrotheca]|uniref:Rhodopsin domain-containing protein n=1 Tax=Echria macrotheca TaxID=438768 RepID=A0AAJ0B6U1_9PEZI|nr:hypothetical protein QBC47DRAFT_389229 [Echria macrotheca]
MSLPKPGDNPEVDNETLVPTLVGMSIAFVSLSSLIVALRLYTRCAIVRSPGPDDLTIAIAQVLSVGVSVVTILQAKYGLGRHVWMVSQEDSLTQLKCLLGAMTIYNLAQIVTKMSFLLQYRRIFQEGGYTRQVCKWLLIFLAAWGITQEVLVCFACVPISLFLPSQAAVCVDSLTIYYLTSIMNIVTDFFVFVVPLPAIRALQLPTRQKWLVMSIFCLGFFTCIISIVRLFTLRAATSTTDPSWANAPSAYWSVVELNCGILCACLPTLRPWLRHMNIHGFSRKSRSDGYRREGSDLKTSFSKGANGPVAAAGGPLYPMAVFDNTASQEALQEHAAEVPSSSIYRPPGYSNRHGGNIQVSRLTNSIKGGVGRPGARTRDEGAENTALDQREREGSIKGIRVTREIDFEKESTDGRTIRSTVTDSDDTRGENRGP